MLSLNNALSHDDAIAFDERVRDLLAKAGQPTPVVTYACELKFDDPSSTFLVGAGR